MNFEQMATLEKAETDEWGNANLTENSYAAIREFLTLLLDYLKTVRPFWND